MEGTRTHMKKSVVTTLAQIFVIGLLCCTAVQAQSGSSPQEAKPAVSPSPAIPKALPAGQGVITDSVYHNSYFGLRITIPRGWTVQGDDFKKELMKDGKSAIVPKNEQEKAEMEAIAERSAVLLTISKLPMGSDQVNASFIAMAEAVAPSVTVLIYIKQLKGFLQQAQVPVKFVDDNQVETINGVQFYTLTVVVNPDENPVQQKYYVLIKKGYALGLITSIISDSDTAAMDSILRSVTVQ